MKWYEQQEVRSLKSSQPRAEAVKLPPSFVIICISVMYSLHGIKIGIITYDNDLSYFHVLSCYSPHVEQRP